MKFCKSLIKYTGIEASSWNKVGSKNETILRLRNFRQFIFSSSFYMLSERTRASIHLSSVSDSDMKWTQSDVREGTESSSFCTWIFWSAHSKVGVGMKKSSSSSDSFLSASSGFLIIWKSSYLTILQIIWCFELIPALMMLKMELKGSKWSGWLEGSRQIIIWRRLLTAHTMFLVRYMSINVP